VKELLSNVGSGGGAPATGAPVAAAAGGAAAAEEKEEAKEEEKEESDDDMVRSLQCFYSLRLLNLFIGLRSVRLNYFFAIHLHLFSFIYNTQNGIASKHHPYTIILSYLCTMFWSLICANGV
jgi:hypothetical protein